MDSMEPNDEKWQWWFIFLEKHRERMIKSVFLYLPLISRNQEKLKLFWETVGRNISKEIWQWKQVEVR